MYCTCKNKKKFKKKIFFRIFLVFLPIFFGKKTNTGKSPDFPGADGYRTWENKPRLGI
jgi:hypothetical protein